jgi:hypothetical protein
MLSDLWYKKNIAEEQDMPAVAGSLGSKNTSKLWWIGVLALVLGCAAISTQSLWIDEGYTAMFASQPTVRDWVVQMTGTLNSEAQMPGYLAYMWGWEKLFGHSEIALRASNVPFLLAFLLVLGSLPMPKRMRIGIGILTLLNPFIWYYMNEARYVIGAFSLGGISVFSMVAFLQSESGKESSRLAKLTLASLVMGVYLNMLFLFILVPLLFLYVSSKGRSPLSRGRKKSEWIVPGVAAASCLLPVLAYYAYTVAQGAGGVRHHPGLENIVEVMHGFFGFAGLGPARNVLRAGVGFNAMGLFSPLAWILMLLIVAGGVVFIANWRIYSPFPSARTYVVAFLIGFGSIGLASFLANFSFLGRHLAFLLPLLFAGIYAVWDDALKKFGSVPSLCFAICFLLLWGVSCFHLRFDERYERENYREGIREAIAYTDSSETLLWAGAKCVGSYYGLDIGGSPSPSTWKKVRQCIDLTSLAPDSTQALLENSHRSVVIMFKKQDLFDKAGLINRFVLSRRAQVLADSRDYVIARIL